MTLLLLSLIAALAQHSRVMCIATILPMHCKLFRHLLQLPPVKVLPVACHLHPKQNCTVVMLLLLSSNTALAQHSRAKPFATAFPLCCRNYTQIPVSGVSVDYFCLSFVILKSMELPGSFLLQAANHCAAQRASRDGAAAFSLRSLPQLCPDTCCRCCVLIIVVCRSAIQKAWSCQVAFSSNPHCVFCSGMVLR